MKDFWIYLLILSGSTYLIRAIPFAAIRKKITNVYVRSFLYYIPYAVLAAMTLPAALYATGNIISGAAGLLVGGIFAYRGKSLTVVAVISCLTAFLAEAILLLIK
jgi:branched-subunit amino acid transport protein